MLSFLRSNDLPRFGPFYVARRNYQPEEGKPFVQQNSTHWFVKMYLPDVKEEEFQAKLNEQHQLEISWSDLKTLRHQGRLYESRETHSTTVDVPDCVKESDIQVSWEGNVVCMAIEKPPVKEENQLSLPSSGTLMTMNLPSTGDHRIDVQVKGKQLVVSVEVENKSQLEDGTSSTSYSRCVRSMQIPEGLSASDIEHHVEENQIVVAVKPKENTKSESQPDDSHQEEEEL